ncbi:MAG: UDP-3-O-acyl-N-acetylglucosamine deacetylase [Kiritimatiellales bacterium]|nr:UDP-3-O-acyl-N-acetylglucosamine deacetylase [Kiritimatiellales bacterium]
MDKLGKILTGDEGLIRASEEIMSRQAVDWDLTDRPHDPLNRMQTTIAVPATISGPGTFLGKATRTITFEPTDREGWWLDRSDQPGSLPTKVEIDNVWTTGQLVSNIVLRSGGPHNYVRMVEHLISIKAGLRIDNLVVKIDSGDPPLFERGSMDIIETLDKCGRKTSDRSVKYCTVKEPVTVGGPEGQVVTMAPPDDPANPRLIIDSAISFPNAIGDQRIIFPVTEELIRMAAVARTNTPFGKILYCKTVGQLFADLRNLGYTRKNVLIACKRKYFNEPRLLHNGKSLETIWHRSVLDLLAAVSLIKDGNFVGKITSYKAGHRLDVEMVTQLYLNDLVVPVEVPKPGGEAS